MEYLVGLLVLALGAIFYYKNKFDKAHLDTLLKDTSTKDAQLKKDQKEVDQSILEMQKRIRDLRAERAKRRKEAVSKTREERAKDWNNGQ